MSVDMTGASDAEFEARIAPFDAAPVPPEVVAAGERQDAMARAIIDALDSDDPNDWMLPALAAAAIAADPSPASVDPAEIVRQRELGWPDFHPEDFCHQCGRPNPTWFADTAEWQTATGSTGDGGGILCPSCFCALWEAKTGKTAIIWRLSIGGGRDAAPRPPSPAEEAVRRVEALAEHMSGSGSSVYRKAAKMLRAELASPAPAPQAGAR